MKHCLGSRLLRLTALLLPALLLAGCRLDTAPVLNPKEPVALVERDLLFTAVGFMMIVVVPVWVMALLFAWRYR